MKKINYKRRWPLFVVRQREVDRSYSIQFPNHMFTSIPEQPHPSDVKVLDMVHKRYAVVDTLSKKYTNLTFITTDDYIDVFTCEGVSIRCRFPVGRIPHKRIQALNEVLDPKAFSVASSFWCTACDKVQDKANYGGSFYCGQYCKACYPQICIDHKDDYEI